MARTETATDFGVTFAEAYATRGAAVELGVGVHDGALVPNARVRVPLGMLNGHGLIAGATGTGKTRSLQVIAEQLSAEGVAVFAADVKGDVSGLAVPGSDNGPAKKRANELGIEWAPAGFPVEYLSVGGIGPGVPVRADSQSARELLAARLEQPVAESTAPPQPTPRQKKAADATARGADAIGDFLTSSSGRALTREVVRGVFGMLKRSL